MSLKNDFQKKGKSFIPFIRLVLILTVIGAIGIFLAFTRSTINWFFEKMWGISAQFATLTSSALILGLTSVVIFSLPSFFAHQIKASKNRIQRVGWIVSSTILLIRVTFIAAGVLILAYIISFNLS